MEEQEQKENRWITHKLSKQNTNTEQILEYIIVETVQYVCHFFFHFEAHSASLLCSGGCGTMFWPVLLKLEGSYKLHCNLINL